MDDKDFDKRKTEILRTSGVIESTNLLEKFVDDIEKSGYCRECPNCGELGLFVYTESYEEDIYEDEINDVNYHKWHASWECQNEETDCDWEEDNEVLTGYYPLD